MKPLNSEERTKQFLIFLIFFIITTALTVGITYFNFNAPQADYQALVDDNHNLRQSVNVSDKYMTAMDSVYNLIQKAASSNNANMDHDYNSADIYNKSFITTNSIGLDEKNNIVSKYFRLTDFTVLFIKQYEEAKKKTQDYDDIKAKNTKLEADNKDLSAKVANCK